MLAGLVESQLQHDRYSQVGSGDRDSVGFLQQRPSMGWGPAGESIERDTDQFLDRALRVNRGFGGSAGQLAQAVQRSAFPERYDQRSGEAEAILRRYGGGGAPRGGGRPATSRGGSAPAQSGGQQLAALLLAQRLDAQEDGPRPSMGLQAPVFSAQAVLPQGARSLPSQAPRDSPGEALARALTAVQALGGPEAPQAPDGAERGVRTPRAPSSGGPAPRGKPGDLLELFWQGPGGLNAKNGRRVPQGFVGGHDRHVHVAARTSKQVLRVAKLARSMGLSAGEHPELGGVGGGHVPNSNHYAGRAIDVTGSPAKLRAFARRVAQLYGVG